MDSCIFCKIVSHETPSHTVWQNNEFVAFLSIFPNTQGVTVVIPKQHYSSYIFDLPENVMIDLIRAAKTVAKILDTKLEDVGKTAMVFEGFGVNHVHAKLFPMHGTKEMKEWRPIKSNIKKYFEKYEGYISTHDGEKADDIELAKLAEKIKK
jgi:diadenosine tetraphosphate (Ap4A) HIT family hydrolase